MKCKLLFLSMALLSVIAACDDDEKTISEEGGGENYPTPETGATYVLEGTVNTEGFTWKTNSVVGLYSAMDELRIINKECRIVGYANTDPIYNDEGENTNDYTPSEYEGKAVGRFETPELDLIAGENKFMIYSPFTSSLSYVDGVIYGLSVGDAQTQTAPNVAADCFSIGMATGIPGVDDVFEFSLDPVTALVQVSINSSELAGWCPEKVTIYDDSGSPMAGGFNIDVNTMEITQVGTPLDRVAVTVSNPVALTSSTTQNIYLNILPADFSSTELWVVVELLDDAGVRLTIPTKQTGLKFEAGKTTEINLTGLNTDMNGAGDWYVATETRALPGLGYAYGEANTFFIQCKDNDTYTGANYSANADIPDEVTIDYRARGNFYDAVAPENVTFEWLTLPQNSSSVYYARTSNYENSNVDPSKYEFTPDYTNKTVTVKNTGAHAGAVVLVMKQGTDVLWAWTFWNVAADGTTLDPVEIGYYKFLPMDIGQPTTDVAKWIGNQTSAGNPDPIYRMTHYYQWGRPIPIFWQSYWSLNMPTELWDGTGEHQTGNVPAIWAPVSFVESLNYPAHLIVRDYNHQSLTDWCTDGENDWWGAATTEEEGVKTIYDPCPKGYRLPPYAAFEAFDNANPTYDGSTAGAYGFTANGLFMPDAGYQQAKITTGESGRPTNMGMGDNGKSNYGVHWTNQAGDNQGSCFIGDNGSHHVGTMDRAVAAPVRCIVDEDNR